MKTLNHPLQVIMTLLGGGLFYYLFRFDYSFGLNAFCFSAFLLIIVNLLYKDIRQNSQIVLVQLTHLLTALMVVWHNSSTSITMYFLSLGALAGFIHQPKLKSILYAGLTAIQAIFKFPQLFFYALVKTLPSLRVSLSKAQLYWMKMVFIPLVILSVFVWIFSLANPVFAEMLDAISFEFLADLFSELLALFSFETIFLVSMGILFTGWLVMEKRLLYFHEKEKQEPEIIQRTQGNGRRLIPQGRRQYMGVYSMIALKKEYQIAVITLILVNVLLFIINTIDIVWLWFNFEVTPNLNLTQLVHEGTYLLILSIFLSMGILIYFFRGNINFYHKNHLLRQLAKAWILQNGLLVLSVVVRNYHYIAHFGLAYKRTAVFVFLLMTIIGLYTMFQKIDGKYSLNYLLRVNAWSVYVILILCTTVNWSDLMANYNIKYASDTTKRFLMEYLDNSTSPILWENQETIELHYTDLDTLKSRAHKLKKEDWQSWNYAEWKAYKFYSESGLINDN